MKLPRAMLLGLLTLLVPAARSDGAPIYFDFTINFTTGTLGGQSFTGSLSVDDADCTAPGDLCSGQFTPNGPLNLLSFDITVGGRAFAMTSDVNFPGFPHVDFSDDVMTSVNYNAQVSGASLGMNGANATFFSGSGASEGNLVGGIREQPTPVPEPASVTLLGLGFAGLGARRWRQRRNR